MSFYVCLCVLCVSFLFLYLRFYFCVFMCISVCLVFRPMCYSVFFIILFVLSAFIRQNKDIYILLLSGLPDRHHGITDKSHIFVRKFVVCHLSVHQKL